MRMHTHMHTHHVSQAILVGGQCYIRIPHNLTFLPKTHIGRTSSILPAPSPSLPPFSPYTVVVSLLTLFDHSLGNFRNAIPLPCPVGAGRRGCRGNSTMQHATPLSPLYTLPPLSVHVFLTLCTSQRRRGRGECVESGLYHTHTHQNSWVPHTLFLA